MAIQTERTNLVVKEDLKVTWETKRWFIFSWNVRLKTESIGKNLYIMTAEKYDRVFFNGKEILNISK